MIIHKRTLRLATLEARDGRTSHSDPRLPHGTPDLGIPVAPPALYALGSWKPTQIIMFNNVSFIRSTRLARRTQREASRGPGGGYEPPVAATMAAKSARMLPLRNGSPHRSPPVSAQLQPRKLTTPVAAWLLSRNGTSGPSSPLRLLPADRRFGGTSRARPIASAPSPRSRSSAAASFPRQSG